LHTNKPVQMDSNTTSIKPSFASLARDIPIELSIRRKPVENASPELTSIVCEDVDEEVMIDSHYDTSYDFTCNLYNTLRKISKEAIYPVFDQLNFEDLFAFLYPQYSEYEWGDQRFPHNPIP